MLDMTIRPALPDDYDRLVAIYQELHALHRENLPDRFQAVVGPSPGKVFLLGRLTDPNVTFLVAAAHDNLLGFVQATLMDTPPIPTLKPRHYAYINEIVVRSDYRGLGLGRLLMAAAEDWAVAHGATSIELGTYEFNTDARAFYERLGYATLHRRLNKPLPAR